MKPFEKEFCHSFQKSFQANEFEIIEDKTINFLQKNHSINVVTFLVNFLTAKLNTGIPVRKIINILTVIVDFFGFDLSLPDSTIDIIINIVENEINVDADIEALEYLKQFKKNGRKRRNELGSSRSDFETQQSIESEKSLFKYIFFEFREMKGEDKNLNMNEVLELFKMRRSLFKRAMFTFPENTDFHFLFMHFLILALLQTDKDKVRNESLVFEVVTTLIRSTYLAFVKVEQQLEISTKIRKGKELDTELMKLRLYYDVLCVACTNLSLFFKETKVNSIKEKIQNFIAFQLKMNEFNIDLNFLFSRGKRILSKLTQTVDVLSKAEQFSYFSEILQTYHFCYKTMHLTNFSNAQNEDSKAVTNFIASEMRSFHEAIDYRKALDYGLTVEIEYELYKSVGKTNLNIDVSSLQTQLKEITETRDFLTVLQASEATREIQIYAQICKIALNKLNTDFTGQRIIMKQWLNFILRVSFDLKDFFEYFVTSAKILINHFKQSDLNFSKQCFFLQNLKKEIGQSKEAKRRNPAERIGTKRKIHSKLVDDKQKMPAHSEKKGKGTNGKTVLKSEANPSVKLFIINLSYHTTEAELALLLKNLNLKVKRTQIFQGRNRGRATVEFYNEENKPIDYFIELINLQTLNDRKLEAHKFYTKKERLALQPSSNKQEKNIYMDVEESNVSNQVKNRVFSKNLTVELAKELQKLNLNNDFVKEVCKFGDVVKVDLKRNKTTCEIEFSSSSAIKNLLENTEKLKEKAALYGSANVFFSKARRNLVKGRPQLRKTKLNLS